MQQLSFALGGASPHVPQTSTSETSLGWEAPDTHRSDQVVQKSANSASLGLVIIMS